MTIDGDKSDDDTRLRYEVTKFTPEAENEAELEVPKGYRRTSEKSTFKM